MLVKKVSVIMLSEVPAAICLLKVNNGNTIATFEICSKLATNSSE